jgi:hypothetical protein
LICAIAAWIAMELFDRSYLNGKMLAGGRCMPMCQSPVIADFLLRARSLPANDDSLLAKADTKSYQAKRAFPTAWLAFLWLLRISVLLLLCGALTRRLGEKSQFI